MKRKSLAAVKKEVAQHAWYRQGGATLPLYVDHPLSACFHFTLRHKPTGRSHDGIMVYYHDGYFEPYFKSRAAHQNAAWYYAHEKRTPGFLRRVKDAWLAQDVAELWRWKKRIEATPLRTLSKAALRQWIKEFIVMYRALWNEAIFLDAFDVASDAMITEEMQRSARSFTPALIGLLTTPEHYSWLQREQRDLIALYKVVLRTPSLRSALKRGAATTQIKEHYPAFVKKVSAHAERYHWLENDYYRVRAIPASRYIHTLRSWLRNSDAVEHIVRELAATKNLPKLKQKYVRVQQIPKKLVLLTSLLTTASEFRDERKAANQVASALLKQLAREVARRTGYTMEEIQHLHAAELARALDGKNLHAVARKRHMVTFYTGNWNEEHHTYYGREAQQLQNFMRRRTTPKRLTGTPAHPGKVKGIVRFVLSTRDFHKLKRGDILVAHNTRPEYVPVMRKAAAIITEEGGITSHPAIVSRELKIPAVVGMQGVIDVLRDGDRVEVDAEKGIVRKIRSSSRR